METRNHGNWGHGLRPGDTRDINCPSCIREDKITPRTLIVRKAADGMLFVSLSEGEYGATIVIAPGEVQFEMMEVIRDEGPREFVLSY